MLGTNGERSPERAEFFELMNYDGEIAVKLERSGTFIIESEDGSLDTLTAVDDIEGDSSVLLLQSQVRVTGDYDSDSASYESATEEEFSLTQSNCLKSSCQAEDESEQVVVKTDRPISLSILPERGEPEQANGCESKRCLGRTHTYLILENQQTSVIPASHRNLGELAERLQNCAQMVSALPKLSPVFNRSLSSLHDSFRRATSLSSPIIEAASSDVTSSQSLVCSPSEERVANAQKRLALGTETEKTMERFEPDTNANDLSDKGLPVYGSVDGIRDVQNPNGKAVVQRHGVRNEQQNTFTAGIHANRMDINGNRSLFQVSKEDLDRKSARGFERLTALIKGHLCRRLLASSRVQGIISNIVDLLQVVLDIHQEGISMSESDFDLHDKLLIGVNESCAQFHVLFFGLSKAEQMKLLKEEDDVKNRPTSSGSAGGISLATVKKLNRKLSLSDTSTPPKSFRRHCCANHKPSR